MGMRKARWLILVIGILLPYLVRLPRGLDWLQQYTDTGPGGWALVGAFNAIAWGAILVASLFYRHPVSLLPPAILGFGFLAYAHYRLDLHADAQAAVALVFIPIYALVPIAAGAIVGYIVDRIARRRGTG